MLGKEGESLGKFLMSTSDLIGYDNLGNPFKSGGSEKWKREPPSRHTEAGSEWPCLSLYTFRIHNPQTIDVGPTE